LEYKWCREIASRIVDKLKSIGVDAERIVTEEQDVSLKERCRRVNAICSKYGSQNVALISIHVNAASSGKTWMSARGWTGWVYTGASSKSKTLAQYLYDAADKRRLKGNRSVPPYHYWQANYAIVRDTNCPAVLTENLFQDNKDDVEFLLSEEGKQTIIDLHVEGITRYIEKYEEIIEEPIV
jgi:N-acetylmuramoyl-L-alanine amidase